MGLDALPRIGAQLVGVARRCHPKPPEAWRRAALRWAGETPEALWAHRLELLSLAESRTPPAGLGGRRIAAELGVARNTIRRYVQQGGPAPYAGSGRAKALDGLGDWLAARLVQHKGNAEVVRQDLASELGIHVSLRTVERAVKPVRQRLEAEARAGIVAALRRGDLAQVRALTDVLIESDGGWIVWRDKFRALLDTPVAELVS